MLIASRKYIAYRRFIGSRERSLDFEVAFSETVQHLSGKSQGKSHWISVFNLISHILVASSNT